MKPRFDQSSFVQKTENEKSRTPQSFQEAQEIIKEQNAQLGQLKEQYLKLESQYHNEKKNSALEELSLQTALKNELKRIEILEEELASLETSDSVSDDSVKVVEQIWTAMKKFHDQIREYRIEY
jgi:predicted RNase H-like nuclease (RuvC/YqgF family)